MNYGHNMENMTPLHMEAPQWVTLYIHIQCVLFQLTPCWSLRTQYTLPCLWVKSFLWFRQKQETLEVFEVIQTAVISEVMPQHVKQTFTCFATNSVGNSSVTIKLKQKIKGMFQSFCYLVFSKSKKMVVKHIKILLQSKSDRIWSKRMKKIVWKESI